MTVWQTELNAADYEERRVIVRDDVKKTTM